MQSRYEKPSTSLLFYGTPYLRESIVSEAHARLYGGDTLSGILKTIVNSQVDGPLLLRHVMLRDIARQDVVVPKGFQQGTLRLQSAFFTLDAHWILRIASKEVSAILKLAVALLDQVSTQV